MLGIFQSNNSPVDNEGFELMFKLNGNWQAVVIVPIRNLPETPFVVRMSNDLILILTLNEEGFWEELHKGLSDIADKLGNEIHQFYLLEEFIQSQNTLS